MNIFKKINFNTHFKPNFKPNFTLGLFSSCLFLALILGSPGASATVSADDVAAARQFTTSFLTDIITVLEKDLTVDQKAARLVPMSETLLSERLAALVLGAPYRQLDQGQKKDYTTAFKKYAQYSIALRLASIKGFEFEITGASAAKRTILVKTSIKTGSEQAIAIDFRLIPEAGSFRLVDVIVAGVSMLATQKSEITNIYTAQGLEALLTALTRLQADQ